MKKKYVFAIIIIITTIIITANYQLIFKTLIPPSPEIVSSYADGTSSTIFNYSLKVKGVVTNKGGDGYIVVSATVYQGSKSWEKTKQLYLESYETEKIEIIFDEVKLLDSDPTYSIKTFSLGSSE